MVISWCQLCRDTLYVTGRPHNDILTLIISTLSHTWRPGLLVVLNAVDNRIILRDHFRNENTLWATCTCHLEIVKMLKSITQYFVLNSILKRTKLEHFSFEQLENLEWGCQNLSEQISKTSCTATMFYVLFATSLLVPHNNLKPHFLWTTHIEITIKNFYSFEVFTLCIVMDSLHLEISLAFLGHSIEDMCLIIASFNFHRIEAAEPCDRSVWEAEHPWDILACSDEQRWCHCFLQEVWVWNYEDDRKIL